MSRRKCALFSLMTILVGTLALASPAGPYARSSDDQSGSPNENAPSKDALTPILQRLTGLLPQFEIEIESGSKSECPACRNAKKSPAPDPSPLQLVLDAMFPDSHLKVGSTADDAVSDSELFQAAAEMDVDQPHAPAILLTPLGKNPSDEYCSDRPRVRLSEARVVKSPSQRILFGVGMDSDCGLAGNIALHESEEIGSACRDNCCVKSDRCQPGDASCCRQSVHIQKLDDDECDDEDDEDDDDAVESFIAQVLQSQMQYLEGMMRARLHHENELMEAKAAAESAFAKQKAEHVVEMMKQRVEHMSEILAMQESIWDSDRKAMSDRHRDAIDHERELAELRTKHVEELQSHRIAALESEVKLLRGQVGSGEPERVAHSPDAVGRQSSVTRRPVLVELPIHVEELTSGRVRYSPIPPKPTDQVTTTKPHDVLERVELTTPPIAATRPTPTEIERLRREVARLHALIEDLVCVAPEAPPSPKPQSSDDDDD